jgi:hypothetical protein
MFFEVSAMVDHKNIKYKTASSGIETEILKIQTYYNKKQVENNEKNFRNISVLP